MVLGAYHGRHGVTGERRQAADATAAEATEAEAAEAVEGGEVEEEGGEVEEEGVLGMRDWEEQLTSAPQLAELVRITSGR
jgi:hypothetical protein